MEKILKESFIFNLLNFFLELIKESFIGRVFSLFSESLRESFIFSVIKRYGEDVSFNISTGFSGYRGDTINIFMFVFVLLIPLSFFMVGTKFKVLVWIFLYSILYQILFEERVVRESFLFRIISGVLS